MGMIWHLLLAVAFVAQLIAADGDSIPPEKYRNAIKSYIQGQIIKNVLYAEIQNEGEEDILRVVDSKGETIAIIDAFPNKEYQLVKPVNVEYCYLVHLDLLRENSNDKLQCYQRVTISDNDPPPFDLTECEGRNVFLLIEKEDCVENRPEDWIAKRNKRRGCTYERTPISKCVEWYCIKYGWWIGRNRCKEYSFRCKRYITEYREIKTC